MSVTQLTTSPIREATATLTVLDGDKPISRKVTVRYRYYTIKALRERNALLNQRQAASEPVYVSETLINQVTELIEDDGKVIPVTLDLLEEMDIENLKAIEAAVNGDVDPK